MAIFSKPPTHINPNTKSIHIQKPIYIHITFYFIAPLFILDKISTCKKNIHLLNPHSPKQHKIHIENNAQNETNSYRTTIVIRTKIRLNGKYSFRTYLGYVAILRHVHQTSYLFLTRHSKGYGTREFSP